MLINPMRMYYDDANVNSKPELEIYADDVNVTWFNNGQLDEKPFI